MNWLRSALFGVATTATLLIGTGSSYAGGPREDRYGGISWAGFYLGVQGGYAWGNTAHSSVFADTGSFDLNGSLGGVTWGTNWQRGNWVYGFESDFSFADIDGSVPLGICGTACFTEIRNLSTSRVRLGYANDKSLVYVTGGLAYGEVRAGINGLVDDDKTRFGWAAGFGAEWRFAPNWSLKADYIHVDLGDRKNYGGGGLAEVDVDVTADIVRVGVNYNLGPNFWGNLIGWR